MRRLYISLTIIFIIIIAIVSGLHLTGYLFNSQKIIPPPSQIEWKNLIENSSESHRNESNDSAYQYPLILNLTEKIKNIPGIENINYEIFVSNDSIHQIVDYYKDILEVEGYEYHDEYSGMNTYEDAEIYHHTFTKGLNGVVIYLSSYNQQTWICYSVSDILTYKDIFDYMIDNDIIQ
jgi:hypothetical protein